jgi:hypothetical protein
MRRPGREAFGGEAARVRHELRDLVTVSCGSASRDGDDGQRVELYSVIDPLKLHGKALWSFSVA